MFKFRSKATPRQDDHSSATTLAEPPSLAEATESELLAELDQLSAANRERRSTETETRMLAIRNAIGVQRLLAHAPADDHPAPAFDALPAGQLPEVGLAQLTPEIVRAGILRHGCLLVRGLVPRADAMHFAQEIDRLFDERDRHDEGQPHDDAYYTEFEPDERFGAQMARPWVKMGGGVLAVDSPMLFATMQEMFAAAGLRELVAGYLGEPPLITGQKTTLRKATPDVPGAWHQDGKFMGQVRALNLWLSLSRCGDESPGLDIVPRRFESFLTTQTDEALLDYAASQKVVEEAAGEAGILRPIFEPGDALFFDDLFMHKTGSDPAMPKPRYAIENWFFGASAFPTEYAPLMV